MPFETLFGQSSRHISGPLLIKPNLFTDSRGFFFESWNEHIFRSYLISSGVLCSDAERLHFCQDNHSRSVRGVLRGLHYQLSPEPQGKLVRCTLGSIFDVAVDLRRSSPTFKEYVSATLSSSNKQQLWIPEGFAHGFLALSDVAEVQYKTTCYWNPKLERSLRWNDPDLSISWPLADASILEPLLAAKDAESPSLSYLDSVDEVFI